MRQALRIFLPILIIAACALVARHFIASKEKPQKFTPPPQVTRVEGETVRLTDYQIDLNTRGTVTPRTTTTLIPQISGRIISISPNFREGGFFEKGEVLVNIEKLDYEAALIDANSQLSQARRNLEEEKARGKQAAESWRRLGKRGTPSEMVLRVPQREEAEARIRAAEAAVERAHRDLERTDISAPYAGRILEQRVDVGQFVTPSTQLGRAFATDFMEVRLPLSNQQLGFVDLPENFRDDQIRIKGPEVKITAVIGRSSSTWNGEIVRVDSSIDQSSRQLFVVAQIEDPYRRQRAGGAALKIGMFVDAVVTGQKLKDVIVLPRSAVRVSGEVIIIDKDNRIQRVKVDPIWKGETDIIFSGEGCGISVGDVVCMTPLAYPVNGAKVLPTIDGIAPKVEDNKFTGKGKGGKGKGGKRGKSGS